MQPIYAIKPGASGDITLKGNQTTNDSIAWSTNRGGPYIPTPIIYGDLLYVLAINGVLAAYDVRTGQRVYQERVEGGGSFSASPVAADGKLYLTSEDGDVFVVKAGPAYELLAKERDGPGDHGDASDLERRDHPARAQGRLRGRSTPQTVPGCSVSCAKPADRHPSAS